MERPASRSSTRRWRAITFAAPTRWENGSPGGHTDPKDIEIVGVVKDAKYDNLRQDTPRLVYLPALQYGSGPNFVQIRGRTGRERQLARSAGIAGLPSARSIPEYRIVSLEPLTAAVNRTLAPDRLVSWLSTGFGIVAILLTSVGLYGILAYTVVRRTSEFGIRMALGAGRLTILQMVMKEALVLVMYRSDVGAGGGGFVQPSGCDAAVWSAAPRHHDIRVGHVDSDPGDACCGLHSRAPRHESRACNRAEKWIAIVRMTPRARSRDPANTQAAR